MSNIKKTTHNREQLQEYTYGELIERIDQLEQAYESGVTTGMGDIEDLPTIEEVFPIYLKLLKEKDRRDLDLNDHTDLDLGHSDVVSGEHINSISDISRIDDLGDPFEDDGEW